MKSFSPTIVILGVFMLINSCEQGKGKSVKSQISKDSFYNTSIQFKEFSSSFKDSINRFFPEDFNGTFLLYKNGRIYKKAIGYSDLQRKSKMRLDDVFQLASVSKTVTAVAVMLLQQEKKIDIDSMVTKYLTDFPYPGITIRQLLNHRSGLANYMYFTDTFWKDTSRYMNNDDFYGFMKKSKPTPYLNPGISFSYCNTNYAFLAVLVERISGQTFYRFVEENIFKPAGMRNSFFLGHKPPRIHARVMVGRYDQYEYTDRYYMDGILGDKSLFSNVEDLFAFHLALSEGRLLKNDILNSMQQASYQHNVYGGSYGLGFRLMMTSSGQWTYHNGWWRGFWTAFWNRFDKKVCMVVLTNNKKSCHVDKPGLADFLLKSP